MHYVGTNNLVQKNQVMFVQGSVVRNNSYTSNGFWQLGGCVLRAVSTTTDNLDTLATPPKPPHGTQWYTNREGIVYNQYARIQQSSNNHATSRRSVAASSTLYGNPTVLWASFIDHFIHLANHWQLQGE